VTDRDLLTRFRTLEHLEEMSIEEAREATDRELPMMFGPVEEVGLVQQLDERMRLYEPLGASSGWLVYFHGGGWAVGSLDSHDGVARHLCSQARCAVVAVDYRLAPEHPFPAALEDAWEATRQVAGTTTERVAVGGDSAGGNLAAVVARRARDSNIAVALQLLVYPALDLRWNSHWMSQYLDGHPATDPDASPVLAGDLAGVAPALILSCGGDELKPQADAYAERLEAAGVPVRHIVYPDLIHNAYCMPGVLPGARKMLEDSAEALAASFR